MFRRELEATLCPIELAVKEVAPSGSLPADTRKSIYRKVFIDLSSEWKETLTSWHPEIDLDRNWFPSMYEKNMLGQMIDIAARTSPLALTSGGLGQTIRHVHRCLYHDILSLGATPDARLGQMLSRMATPIAELWHESRMQMGNVLDRQGGHVIMKIPPPIPSVSYNTPMEECRGITRDQWKSRRDAILKNLVMMKHE